MIRFERSPSGDLVAHAVVPVGIANVVVQVELGPWFADAPDPAGLAMTPVIALNDVRWTEVARAAALRAGGMPSVLLLPASAPYLGGQLLVAVNQGVELVIVEGGGASALRAVRALGGRAILALPLADLEGLSGVLAELDVDIDIAIPSFQGATRTALRDTLAPFALEERHHPVDVDPAPSLIAAGMRDAEPAAAASAAAGILAGRLAAENRRWWAALR